MAAGKNIEIRIAASGGAEAASEIKKPEDAVGSLEERIEALKERARDLREENAKVGESQERVTSKLNVARAATAGLAIGGAILKDRLKEIIDGLNSIDIEQLRQLDPVMANQAETAQKWGNAILHPLNSLQELLSETSIFQAFADMNEQLALNAKGADIAGQKSAILAKRFDEESDAADRAAEALKRRNKELDAKDKADAKERDAADAAAVRGGAAKEDVDAERARYNAAKEIERINRELDAKADGVNTKGQLVQDKKFLVGDLERNGADPKEIEKAKGELQKLIADFEKAKADFKSAQTIAADERRGVNTGATATVKELESDKAERLKREADQQAAKEKREADKQAADAKREADKAERAAEARDREAAAAGRTAVSLIPKDASDRARKAVEAAAAKLQDGDQGGELEALLAMVEKMAGFVEKTKGSDSANAIKINQLAERLRRLEGK